MFWCSHNDKARKVADSDNYYGGDFNVDKNKTILTLGLEGKLWNVVGRAVTSFLKKNKHKRKKQYKKKNGRKKVDIVIYTINTPHVTPFSTWLPSGFHYISWLSSGTH